MYKFINDDKNMNIIPKRSFFLTIGNIDLKQLLSKKMDKINHRTEAAIV